jgi:hypothetical protein
MAVDIARIAFAGREYRSVTSEDLSVQTRRPLATELTYNTFIGSSAEALTFGNGILSLLKQDRYNWSIRVKRDVYNVSVGDTITVIYPRFGLETGKNFIVKRVRIDTTSPFVDMALFGPE